MIPRSALTLFFRWSIDCVTAVPSAFLSAAAQTRVGKSPEEIHSCDPQPQGNDPGLKVIAHTGLLRKETAAELKEAGWTRS